MVPDSPIIEFLESAVYGDRRDPLARVVRGLLYVLSLVYRIAIRLYLLPFDLGIRRRAKLDKPVISVGNITVGGTGKSPTVEYLCRGLSRRQVRPAILSYGYGGELGGRFGIVSDGRQILLTPEDAGDEPVMLARKLPGVPVMVSRDRAKSGIAAVQDFCAEALIMDDGFQVWQVERDLDIVLLTASNPLDNGWTLPAGKLREPVSALRRADCILAVGEIEEQARRGLLARIHRINQKLPVFFGRFTPKSLVGLDGGSEKSVQTLLGRKVFGVCSIARPEAFQTALEDLGAEIVGWLSLPDHHLYLPRDIAYINRCAEETSADLIVTTDKDAVKLDAEQFALPVEVLGIELCLEDELAFWEFVSESIGLWEEV